MFTVVRHKSGTVAGDRCPFSFRTRCLPFEEHISVSAPSSKMNRRLVWQKAMWIEQDFPTYNASINLHIKYSEREKSCGLNKKKFAIFALRILYASPLAQGTSMCHCSIVCTASLNVKVIAYSFCWGDRKSKYDFYSKAACSNCK